MRDAFRGRAAAYEELKQYPQTRADLSTLVLLNETALMTEKDSRSGYSANTLEQTILAHRERAKFLNDRGQTLLAKADLDRARELESGVSLKPNVSKSNNWIRLINDLDKEVTVVFDNEKYILKPKEQKKFRHTPGTYTYEVPGVVAPRKGDLEEGKMNTIRIYPPEQ